MPTIATLGAASARAFGLFGSTAGTAGTDPYFFYNTLLLPGNGTNGAQNNTFLDSSTNNFTITRNGNTTQGTFTPYGSNWGNYFGGSDYIATPSDAKFGTGTGNFTIEAWVFITSLNGSTENNIIGNGSSNGYLLGFFGSSVYLATNGGGYTVQITYTLPLNQWVHVAAVRSGNTGTIYINGTSIGSGSYTTNVPTGVGVVGGDYRGGTSYTMRGYVSNARISNTARYSSNFTPSTTPLTSDANTLLLTCQSNRFIDNSASPLTLTVTGSPSVQRFSPFNPSAPYAAGTIGGSGYFDGSGDYLNFTGGATNAGTSDLCLEFFAYWTGGSFNDYKFAFDSRTSGGGFIDGVAIAANTSTGAWYVSWTGQEIIGASKAGPYWNHVCLTRQSGTFRLFVDGVLQGTYTPSPAQNYTSTTNRIGWYYGATASYQWTGYLTEVMSIKGSVPAAYQTSSTTVGAVIFTPPTAPLTAVSGTSLLLNMTNGGIIDNAMMNDLETVGNAQISTTQSKFGGASLYFDGTGDYLVGNANAPVLDSGSGQITIEGWFYLTANIANGAFGQVVGPIGASGTSGLAFGFTGSSGTTRVGASYVSTGYGGTVAISLNTWTHVAWVLTTSTTLKTYINGTLADTFTLGGTQNVKGIFVGAGSGGASPITGYIDDFRITKGYARYTANFTPPTAAFPLS